MQKFFKYLLFTFLALIAIIVAIVVIAIFGEDIAKSWRKLTYTHPSQVAGISIGDDINDVIFLHGPGEDLESDEFEDIKHYENLNAYFYFNQDGKLYFLKFVPDSNNSSYKFSSFPIKTVDNLSDKFGEPNIFASADDPIYRRYTYSNDGLTTGITYEFKQNQMLYISLGEISWRPEDNQAKGVYIVNGRKYCPGPECPWDKNGIKSEWKEKSVRELIKLQ